MKKNIAVFASGEGTNFEKIINYLKMKNRAFECVLFCDNKKAGVIKRSIKLGVKNIVFNKDKLKNGEVLSLLKKHDICFIILSGFLFLIPEEIVVLFKKKIINIHPALLPDFGGKGMFGINVHKAVISSNANISGITIHYIDENYDTGEIIFQKKCPITKTDSTNSLQKKIRLLEHSYYPKIIDKLLFYKKNIIMYTDGAALGNPGKGGLGVVLISGKHRKEISEGYRLTTNNRMELLAVIRGLESIKNKNSIISIYSDSTYVVKAINEKWLFKWEKTNFKKKKNPDLWKKFLKLYKSHSLKFIWVKGHSNVKENERCDFLAVEAANNSSLLIDEKYENINQQNLF